MLFLLLGGGGGGPPFPWNHTFVQGDPFLRADVVTPFLSALNERIAAVGYAFQYPLTPYGAAALTGTPASVSPPHLVGTIGSWTHPGGTPFYSWNALQDLTYHLAANYFCNEDDFDPSDSTTWTDFFDVSDYTSWPPGGGYTRKREPEITTLSWSTGFVDGDRARFIASATTLHSDYLNADMPATPSGERQYSAKIMKRVSGAWVVDADQVTPLTLWVLYGRAKSGDVFGPWILNEMRDAINRLNALVILGGNAPPFDGMYEFWKRDGASGTQPTLAAAKSAAEAAWAAATDTLTDEDDGSPGAGHGRWEFYFTTGGGSSFQATIRTAKIRLNGPGFQLGPDQSIYAGLSSGSGTTPHGFYSDVDLYVRGILSTVAFFPTPRTYTPRPSSLTQNALVLFQTLGVDNSDTRTSNWFGDIDTLMPAPSSNPATNNWQADGQVMLQRFKVAGGFTYA
jgi:hypothetical protein